MRFYIRTEFAMSNWMWNYCSATIIHDHHSISLASAGFAWPTTWLKQDIPLIYRSKPQTFKYKYMKQRNAAPVVSHLWKLEATSVTIITFTTTATAYYVSDTAPHKFIIQEQSRWRTTHHHRKYYMRLKPHHQLIYTEIHWRHQI